jgi:hypothetical protein
VRLFLAALSSIIGVLGVPMGMYWGVIPDEIGLATAVVAALAGGTLAVWLIR